MDTLGRFARTWGVMLALVLALLSPQAFAQDFPVLSGRVVDAAGMMTRAQAEALQLVRYVPHDRIRIARRARYTQKSLELVGQIMAVDRKPGHDELLRRYVVCGL